MFFLQHLFYFARADGLKAEFPSNTELCQVDTETDTEPQNILYYYSTEW